MLTKEPVRKPRNPTMKRKTLRAILHLVASDQLVTESMIGGAIKASVDELTAPTREMNRSNFGMAAASETRGSNLYIRQHSEQGVH